jgi:hypothetical protein
MGAEHQIYLLKIAVHGVGDICHHAFFSHEGNIDDHQPVMLVDDIRVRAPALYSMDLHGSGYALLVDLGGD